MMVFEDFHFSKAILNTLRYQVKKTAPKLQSFNFLLVSLTVNKKTKNTICIKNTFRSSENEYYLHGWHYEQELLVLCCNKISCCAKLNQNIHI